MKTQREIRLESKSNVRLYGDKPLVNLSTYPHDRLIDNAFQRREAFLHAMRDYNAHQIARFVGAKLTRGIDWRGCTKGHIAESIAMGGWRHHSCEMHFAQLTANEFRARLQQFFGHEEGGT